MSVDRTTAAVALEAVHVQTADGTFAATFAKPSAPTHCALIILQEIFGVTSKIRRYCEMFARDGYAVMAPDLFWRKEPGVQLGYSEADIQRAMGFLHHLDEDRALDDVVACAKLLRSQGYTRIGVVGFCLGGKLGPLSLARGAGDAAVAFYGVGLEQHCEVLRTLTQPIQMHFGDKDTHIPLSAVVAMQEIANEHRNIEVIRHAEGGHAFFRPDLKNEESQLAYRQTLAFLKHALAN